MAQTPKRLSGGNPRIAKGEGSAVVEAYLAAMPGWKQDVGRQLDRLICAEVPEVHKAVKWNTPFYGIAGDGWFTAFHCLTRYVKVTFFQGAALDPLPPVGSKQPDVRYLHVFEAEPLDEARFRDWIRQARALPLAKL
jgi:hypothetical protein